MTTAASAMPVAALALPTGSQLPSQANGSGGAPQTLTQNQFLQLLTAQLEHQDPLNPLSPDQFASELAEFSTATGVQNLAVGSSSQQAVGLVGHNVAVAGSALILGQSGGAMGAFNLPVPAKDVAVAISDPTGKVVANLDLGAVSSGSQTFSWNGAGVNGAALPSGTYGFSIAATGANGAALAATPYTVVPVTGAALNGQNGPMLDLGGGLAPVPLTAVQQVF